jgi:hypothetical protein
VERLPSVFGVECRFGWRELSVICLKSIIAGVMALLLAGVLTLALTIVPATIRMRFGNARQVLLFSLKVFPFGWLLPIIIFGAGFYWEYRRLSK